MAVSARRRQPAAMPYRYMIVGEDGLGTELLGGLAGLLSATLDEGERYRERAWRTLRPAYRTVALAGDGAPVGQASCFWVPCRPAFRLLGLGDVAVAPAHRRRQVARTLCSLAAAEAWRLHAGAILAKTTLLRTVLADLDFARATDGRFFWMRDGERAVHPDWMAAVRTPLPASLRLEEGDF
jgi:GNAT superfamily N-acetyltransferase